MKLAGQRLINGPGNLAARYEGYSIIPDRNFSHRTTYTCDKH